MPTISLPAFTQRFGPEFFQPQVVGHDPTAGLKNRLLLAQIRREESEPGLAEREFGERQRQFNVGEALREREAGETERYHRGEETYRGEELGFRHEALAQQLREAREAHEAQVMDTLVRTAPYLGIGSETLGDVLKRSGYPQLAETMAAATAAKSEAAFQQNLAAYRGAKPDVREKILRGLDEPTQARITSTMAKEALPAAPEREGPAPWETERGSAALATPFGDISGVAAQVGRGISYLGNLPFTGGGATPSGGVTPFLSNYFNTKAAETARRTAQPPSTTPRRKRGSELSITPP